MCASQWQIDARRGATNVKGQIVTIRPGDIDGAASGAGVLASAYNFVLGGELNILIGAIVGALSIAVLIQRFVINRRAMRNERDAD